MMWGAMRGNRTENHTSVKYVMELHMTYRKNTVLKHMNVKTVDILTLSTGY